MIAAPPPAARSRPSSALPVLPIVPATSASLYAHDPGGPRPFAPRAPARLMYALHRTLSVSRFWYRVALRLQSSPWLYRLFVMLEELAKKWLFGCRMCAQCALPTTAYTCPMTCPKQLRNGPCGGVSPAGNCEVYPELRCVWLVAYERAEEAGRVADLRRLQRPIDQRKWGESSWVNYWLGRDEELWTENDALGAAPLLGRAPASEERPGCGAAA